MEGKRLGGLDTRICQNTAISPGAVLRGKRDQQSGREQRLQLCRREPVLVVRGVGHHGSARQIVSHRNDREQKERDQARQGYSNNNSLPL